MEKPKFGTGGWRAVIGDGFTKANVQLLATAIVRKLKDDGQADAGFVIGFDRRFLSREAAQWSAEAVAGQGVYCRLISRESPTPLIMYEVNRCGAAYGMAITASHDPAVYNGVKVFMHGGRDAEEGLTFQFEEYIDRTSPADILTVPYEKALAAGTIELVDPTNDYIDGVLATLDGAAIRKAGLRVALDPMFGVSKVALQTILLTCRAEVEVMPEQGDALPVSHLPDPEELTLAGLKSFVLAHGCHIGIATDGDADRLGVVDDEANYLHPNKVLALLYWYLMKHKGWRGAAVRNIATTHLLDRIAAAFGEVCYEVPVGFKYISAKMEETGAIMGGESSGGLTVRGHIQGKDGIFAAGLLVEMLAVTGQRLSDLWRALEAEYGRCEVVERAYALTGDRREAVFFTLLVDRLLPAFAHEVERVSYLDGCKVYFGNGGWVIARFSGTEPVLRIFAEMDNRWEAELVVGTLESFLEL